MPQISFFFGIIIKMFWDDHLPMHFHAEYGEHKARINIDECKLLDGKLPPRVLGLVIEWTIIHQKELIENWNRCENKEQPLKIEPLS